MNRETSDTLEALAGLLVEAAMPLRPAVSNLSSFRTFLHRLGWQVESLPPAYEDLGSRVDHAQNALDSLRAGSANVQTVLDEVKGLYEALKTLSEGPAGVDGSAFLSEIGDTLFDLLVVDHLASTAPCLFNALRILGAIEEEYHKATPERPAFLLYRLRLEELRRVLDGPGPVVQRVFGWGTDKFDFDLVAGHLLNFFAGLRVPATLSPVPEQFSRGFDGRSPRQ